MSNPYATPKAHSAISPRKKSRWRILKHICIFVILFLAVNFDRFFDSAESAQDIPKVSITAGVITLLLFYGVDTRSSLEFEPADNHTQEAEQVETQQPLSAALFTCFPVVLTSIP